jgi:hypothetical protein
LLKKSFKEGNKKCIEKITDLGDHQERCIKLPVQNVIRKQKFLSNRMVLDPSIVGNVIRNVNQEDFSKNGYKNA